MSELVSHKHILIHSKKGSYIHKMSYETLLIGSSALFHFLLTEKEVPYHINVCAKKKFTHLFQLLIMSSFMCWYLWMKWHYLYWKNLNVVPYAVIFLLCLLFIYQNFFILLHNNFGVIWSSAEYTKFCTSTMFRNSLFAYENLLNFKVPLTLIHIYKIIIFWHVMMICQFLRNEKKWKWVRFRVGTT